MGKRRAKAPEESPPWEPSLPYLLRDPNQIAGGLWLVVSTTFCGVVAVSRRVYMPGVSMAVCKRVIMDWELPRFIPVPWTEETSLHSFVAGLKSEAVAHGADAEAVYLLGELSPFEPKEMNIMAEKLKGKTKPVGKGGKVAEAVQEAKAAKVAKTPKTPKGTGRNGNPQGLEKARAATAGKRAEARAAKIKSLKKVSEIEARDGTFRKQMLTDVLKAKTVGEFYDMDEKYDAGCIRFAKDAGYIEVA